jgi:hypothetical protein
MSKRPDLDRLRAVLNRLNLDEAKQVYGELGAIVQALEQQSRVVSVIPVREREIVEVQHLGDRLYQLERVRCGKVGCKCGGEAGELHGPYWYAYWRVEGKLKSRYVGKKLKPVE